MKIAIILHGMPSKKEYFNPESPSQSNKHWIPWVQKQLILNDILTQTPELPEPYEPDYKKWQEVFEQFNLDQNTQLIGHSCGAGFLVRWLTENNTKVGKVALIAPFIDPNRNEVKSDFFDFEIKKDLSKQTDKLCVFYSKDDDKCILESVRQIRASDKSIQTREFDNKGHFTLNDMKTEKFPELVEFLT
ncbi:MAG: RBBP9/YdeN family alpha/beta hydrolase [Patescibacteria group bacterium]|jgi:predicted alpha/beta hydrolase family esterase